MLPRQILSFFVKGCMYKRRKPKIGERCGPSLAMGARLTIWNYFPPHTCYPAEFGRSRSNGSEHNEAEPSGKYDPSRFAF